MTFRYVITLIYLRNFYDGKTGCYNAGLDKVLVKQNRKQLCVLPRNQIILWCFLNTILKGELLRSLVSRLLLVPLLMLLKLGLITQISNNVGGGHNIDNMLISRIPSLRLKVRKTQERGLNCVSFFFS